MRLSHCKDCSYAFVKVSMFVEFYFLLIPIGAT
jgi:hypothetical protein